jgi:hypothetical protein
MPESLREYRPGSVFRTRRQPADLAVIRPAAAQGATWVFCAFVAHRSHGARSPCPRPVIRPALGLAAALAAALAVAGCTSAPAGTASTGTSGPPAITVGQARQVWDRYAAVSRAETRTAGNPALALSLETGPQRAYDAATDSAALLAVKQQAEALHVSESDIRRDLPALAPPAYTAPAFYLPAQSEYPRFFVVAVTQKLTGDQSSVAAAPHAVDGAEVYPSGPELMLFEQASTAASWLLASASSLAAGEALPKLATDSAGYIPTVTPSAAMLLAKPEEVGALQAAVVDDGPASTATAAVADGQLTTGLYRGALNHADGLTAPHGDVYQWELEGTSYPGFALRTATGGALVFYAMALDTTVAVPDYISKADHVRSGRPIQVPAEVQRLLPSGQPAPLIDLESEQLLSFAAVDPASTGSKIHVIAVGGGLTSATAS